MTTVTIGTFNMSFASDKGLNPKEGGNGNFASEATWMLSNPHWTPSNPQDETNPRFYWNNALDLIIRFFQEHPNSALGLQELNKTAAGTGEGSAVIEAKIASDLGANYQLAVDEIVVNPNQKPALGIIWNTDVFGTYVRHSIKDLVNYPLEEIAGANGVVKQYTVPGRPILMVETSKGFLLATAHGPNNTDTTECSKRTQSDLQREIRKYITEFKPEFDITKVFIMGDFNDNFDGLREIVLADDKKLKYQGQAPKSCCHNWNSSCTKEEANPDETSMTGRYIPLGMADRPGAGSCRIPKVGGVPLKTAGPGPRQLMGEQGYIENYAFTGDKVFGANPAGDIQNYPEGRTGTSDTSDHEMVIANFTIPAAGGGRNRNNRNNRKNKKTQRKQRDQRKRNQRKRNTRKY